MTLLGPEPLHAGSTEVVKEVLVGLLSSAHVRGVCAHLRLGQPLLPRCEKPAPRVRRTPAALAPIQLLGCLTRNDSAGASEHEL